jgi:hypothetical protein
MIEPKFVMIPTAYKFIGASPSNQKVYSILPTASPNADFLAGRNSIIPSYVTPEDTVLESTLDVRLDWQDRKTCPTLWLERSSTSRLLWNENIISGINLGIWQTSGISTLQVAQDPTNQNKGFVLTNNGTVTSGDFGVKQQFWGAYGFTRGYATVSVYVKRIVSYDDLCYIRLKDSLGNRVTMKFDFNNEQLSLEDSSNWNPEKNRVVKASNGWYRLELSVLTTGFNNCTFEIQPKQRSGARLQMALPMAEILPYNGFLNPQGLSHSFIKTEGSLVTQGNEFCYDAISDIFSNNLSGSFFVELEEVEFTEAVTESMISISTDDDDDAVQFLFLPESLLSQTYSVRARVIAGGNNVADILINGFDRLNTIKIAATWDVNYFKLFINGALVDTRTNLGSVPIQLDRISFSNGQQYSNFFGKVNNIQYFDEAIPESQAIQKTTI